MTTTIAALSRNQPTRRKEGGREGGRASLPVDGPRIGAASGLNENVINDMATLPFNHPKRRNVDGGNVDEGCQAAGAPAGGLGEEGLGEEEGGGGLLVLVGEGGGEGE